MAHVQYIGLEEADIDRQTRELLDRRILRELEYLRHKGDLVVHVKEYKRKGKQHKFSVHVRFGAGHVIPVHAHSWNVLSAVDKCFDKLALEL
jgi:ribosome-associated translation inhibitor RaiA